MRARLLVAVAAACALVSLGVTWTFAPGDIGLVTPGTTTLTTQYNYFTEGLDLVPQYNPGFFFPGSPGAARAGYADEVRIGLVPAAAILVAAWAWPSRRTRRATAMAAVALALCALWGFGHHLVRGPLLAAAAAALALVALRRGGRRRTERSGGGATPQSAGPATAGTTF